MRRAVVAAAMTALLLPVMHATASEITPRGALSPLLAPVDEEPDCDQIPPDHLPPIPADTSKRLRLRVLVLVERDKAAHAKRVFQRTVTTYKRINIDVVAVRWDTPARFRVPTIQFGLADPSVIMKAVRDRYDGRRPAGVDVVYHFTPQAGGGLADCIGGVHVPTRAFALGALGRPEGQPPPLVATPAEADERDAFIASHELGHLLGGHHHYGNCAEGLPDAPEGRIGCTIMNPTPGLATRRFGAVETAFIRDTLARYKPSPR